MAKYKWVQSIIYTVITFALSIICAAIITVFLTLIAYAVNIELHEYVMRVIFVSITLTIWFLLISIPEDTEV